MILTLRLGLAPSIQFQNLSLHRDFPRACRWTVEEVSVERSHLCQVSAASPAPSHSGAVFVIWASCFLRVEKAKAQRAGTRGPLPLCPAMFLLASPLPMLPHKHHTCISDRLWQLLFWLRDQHLPLDSRLLGNGNSLWAEAGWLPRGCWLWLEQPCFSFSLPCPLTEVTHNSDWSRTSITEIYFPQWWSLRSPK